MDIIIFTLIWSVFCVLVVWGFVVAKTGLGMPESKPKIPEKKRINCKKVSRR